MRVAERDLDTVMAGLAATGNVDGLLVTMPHKHSVFARCATSSERSAMLEVVSVVRRNDDGSWHGDMLDGIAFVKAQQDNGAQFDGARALLLGAGGAGSAIAIALLDAGIGRLVIHDLDESSVTALRDRLPERDRRRVTAGPAQPTGCDLVFNATPLGMAVGDPLPVDPGLLESSMFVGDVIAAHGVTPLISSARAVGCRTATGSDMVVAVQELMSAFLLHEYQE